MEEKIITYTDNPEVLFSNSLMKEGFDAKRLTEKRFSFSTPEIDVRAESAWLDGIRIGYSEWNFKKDTGFEWKADLDLVTLYFNLHGKATTDITVYGKDFTLGNYQHNIFYAPQSSGFIRNHNSLLITFMVQFRVEKFIELIKDSNEVLQQFGESVAKGRPCTLSQDNLYIDGKLLHTIESIRYCSYEGGIRKMFLFSKCLELLVLQADAYDRHRSSGNKILKTEYDKERILFAREYLLEHMDHPPSLTELSRRAGVNTFKLKNGFKEMFGNTVFGYLADKRLELSVAEIAKKEKSISEIAMSVGYSSVQHFSKAFKKKYGVTPKKSGR